MLLVKSVVILKRNPGILKHVGGKKMWMWLCIKRELFRIWKQTQNEEDWKKYCEANKMLREQYIWPWISRLGGQWICVLMVVSCLDLPNKGLGREKMLLGLGVLIMNVEQ